MDDDLYQFVPSGTDVSSDGYNPLALQITLFTCGGITLERHPSTIPVWDRHCLTSNNFNGQVEKEQEPPKLVDFMEACSSVATSSYTPTKDMVCEIINVKSQHITHLKEKVAEQVTTLEIPAAHVWRSRCRALKLSQDGNSLFGMAVGIRRVVDPPLPEGYYGNAFVKTNVAMKAGELSNSPLSHVVKLIKEAKRAALEKRYVLEQLKETERMLMMKINVACEGGHGAFTLLTDWRQLGLLAEVGFGESLKINIGA